MISDKIKRQQLLEFLDRKVFDPVLEATPQQYSSDKDRKMLVDVQEVLRYEKDRFHFQFLSAQMIKESYLSEIAREGGRIARELEDLELPRMKQFKEQFLSLCSELNI